MKEYNKIRDNKIAAARKRRQRLHKGKLAKSKKVKQDILNIKKSKLMHDV